MPKIAFLSDIHANLHAFKAVLAEVAKAGARQLAICGDLVGYGAHARECVELAQKLNASCIMGNHDLWVLKVKKHGPSHFSEKWETDPVVAGLAHAASSLTLEDFSWLEQLPYAASVDGAVLVHASLDQPAAWNYVDSMAGAENSLAILRGHPRNVAFCGHNHLQRLFLDSGKELVPTADQETFDIPKHVAAVVAVGSVGQSRDGDPRATWAIWDDSARTVQFRRTAYDYEGAAKAILDAGLPEASALRLLPSV